MKTLLSVKELNLSFLKKGQKNNSTNLETKAVKDISFEIGEGECIAIVGESGCGKSATLLSLLKLHGKGTVSTGEIFFRKEPLHCYSDKQMEGIRGKKIALINQDPMSALNPTMRIVDQIIEALPRDKFQTKVSKLKKAIELLKETGINDPEARCSQYPFEFSGGMLQRVAIAMALAGEPDIILADEPTTSLDVTLQKQVLTLIKRLQIKNNMALILVSHDLAVVSETADRVLVMYAGELVEETKVDELFKSPQHPYTQALLEALPKVNQKKEVHKLATIEGQPPDLSLPILGCCFADRCSKTMKICLKENPPLKSVNVNHKVRCWLYHEDYKAQKGEKVC